MICIDFPNGIHSSIGPLVGHLSGPPPGPVGRQTWAFFLLRRGDAVGEWVTWGRQKMEDFAMNMWI